MTAGRELPAGSGGFRINAAIMSWLRQVQVGLEYDNIQRVPDWLKKQTGESSILSAAAPFRNIARDSGPKRSSKDSSGARRPQMNLKEVMVEVRLSRTTITRLMKDGLFPQHHYNSPGRRFWYSDEIREYQRRAPDRKPDAPRGDGKGTKG